LLVETGQLERAEAHLHAAAAFFRDTGDEDGELDVLILLTRVLRDLGRFRDGAACAEVAAALAVRRGDTRRQGATMHNLIFDDLRLGLFDTATARLNQLAALPAIQADRRARGLLAINQAEAHYLAGRIEDSRNALERAVAYNRSNGDATRLAKSLSRLAICEAELGHPDRAADRLAEAGDAAADDADGAAYPWLALSSGVLAAGRGDRRSARRELRSALNGFTVFGQLREQIETLLRLAAVADGPGEARALVDQAGRLATEKEVQLSVPERRQLEEACPATDCA
jgi:tetratricopeptide (TPR) repeat protein